MNHDGLPLLVELFLHGARIKGLSREVERRRRLADVLNARAETFELESVVMTLNAGVPMQAPSLSIARKSIIAAIPWETKEQDRKRALDTSMSGRSQTTPVPVVVFSPPIVIAGTAHMLAGYATSRETLHPDLHAFAHFFPVTNAHLTLDGGAQMETPVVLVNRDCVSAIGRAVETARLRLAG